MLESVRPLHYSEGGRANIRTREGVQLFERGRKGLSIRGREAKFCRRDGGQLFERGREGNYSNEKGRSNIQKREREGKYLNDGLRASIKTRDGGQISFTLSSTCGDGSCEVED